MHTKKIWPVHVGLCNPKICDVSCRVPFEKTDFVVVSKMYFEDGKSFVINDTVCMMMFDRGLF